MGMQGGLGPQGVQGAVGPIANYNVKQAASLATTQPLSYNPIYVNGTVGTDGGRGSGAILQAATDGVLIVDGVAPSVGARVLVKNQANKNQNGIYTVTAVGSVSTFYSLTRATDYDNATTIEVSDGDFLTVTHGTTNADTTWIMNADGTGVNGSIVIGTDNITFVQTGGLGIQGLQGAQGTTGAGTQGQTGFQGAQGFGYAQLQGIQGPSGFGSQGLQGFQGGLGVGLQGIQGPAGSVQGTQGLLGFQGATGQGIQGPAGSVQGVQGLIGFQGIAGSGTQGISGSNANVTLSSAPPSNPQVNDIWIDNNSGSEYTYVNDGNSFQWVELSASGFVGAQGPVGPTGPAGAGFQGVQGIQGSLGIQGPQGLGAQGIQGPNAAIAFGPVPPTYPNIGDRWVDSNSGSEYTWVDDGNSQQWVEVSASGFSGVQGAQGVAGSGSQGIQGLAGQSGAQGFGGTQGATGIGLTGAQGAIGATGIGTQGLQGIQGLQGGPGAQGLQGPNAAISFGNTPPVSPLLGDRWVDSASGSEYTWISDGNSTQWVEVSASGFSGLQGLQGAAGAGAQGIQGPAGTAQGAIGLQGIQGYFGPQGLTGFGEQGLQGAQGLQGNLGIQGAQGVQGVQGPTIPVTFSATPPSNPNINDRWVDSTSGSEYTWINDGNSYQWVELSASGFSGVQGLQGPAGVGSQGLQGFVGVQGAVGLQGLTGAGAQGIQGPAGSGGSGSGNVTFSSTPPLSPNVGDHWVDSTSGSDYTWLNDGNSFQWAQLSQPGPVGLQGAQGVGVQGIQGVKGPGAYTISVTPPVSPNFGDTWVDSNTGRTYLWDSAEWFESNNNLNGVQGATGLQGAQGFGYAQLQGLQGGFGPQGLTGIQGFSGTNGAQGIQGINGPGTYNINLQSTTPYYTASINDGASIVNMSFNSANQFQIPTNASVPLVVGSSITIFQIGTGTTTITAISPGTTNVLSSASVSASPKLRTQYSSATCIKTAVDTWQIAGDII
jgi:hypothetical protein